MWVALVLVAAAGIGVGSLLPGGSAERRTTPVADGDRTRVVGPGERTPEELVADLGDAVWRVDATGCGGGSVGTAFAVDEHHLVTNWHVTVSDPTPTLTSRDGATTLDGEVVGWSPQPDVALVRVDDPLPLVLPWVDAGELAEGQTLVAMGFPLPFGDFTVSSLGVMSFVAASGERGAIRAEGLIDAGNSGGPALTLAGEVAGIVTEVEELPGETVRGAAIVYTHDRVASTLAAFAADPARPDADCEASAAIDQVGPAETYGDDGALDILWDGCDAGDLEACDRLYWSTPLGSGYERHGGTCGERRAFAPGGCADELG